jgi:DNA-binding PadR family transcriptional regulator
LTRTLDLLMLRTLAFGAQHGQGTTRAIQRSSRRSCWWTTETLYPALQRLETKRWIEAEWGVSTNNRRARFYRSTRGTELTHETSQWRGSRRQSAACWGRRSEMFRRKRAHPEMLETQFGPLRTISMLLSALGALALVRAAAGIDARDRDPDGARG